MHPKEQQPEEAAVPAASPFEGALVGQFPGRHETVLFFRVDPLCPSKRPMELLPTLFT